jgi:hypothetical protein
MKKVDIAIVVEIAGATLATTGLAMIYVPASLIAAGIFLVWLTEKAN